MTVRCYASTRILGGPTEDDKGAIACVATGRQAVGTAIVAHADPLLLIGISVTFKGVGPGGGDIYELKFDNGTVDWRILLAADGKVAGVGIRKIP
jgi:hypothetical protein